MTHALLSSPPALALLPDAALVLDAHGRVLSASPPAAAMFGLDPTGRGLAELIPDPARLWEAVDGVPAGGTRPARPARGPARRRRAVRARRQRARARRRRRCCACCASSTATRPERSTPPSTRCRSGMALFNTDGEYVRVNGALCALLGRAPDELIGTRDQELTHPDDRQSDVDAAWRILNGELEHLAVREALRAPGRLDRLDAGEPHLPARRARPPAVLGRAVPGRHRAAADGLARSAHRRAQPPRVRRRARALRGLRARGGAAPARPRRLQGDQRRPRPSRRRRAAAPDRGHDPRPAAPRRRARAARRRRVRRAAAAQRGRAGRAAWPTTSPSLVAGQRFHFDGVERAVTASVGLARVGDCRARRSPRPTARCTRPRPSAAVACAALTEVTSRDLVMPQFVA